MNMLKKLLIILLVLCGTSQAFTLKKIYPIGGDDPQKYLFTLSDTLQYNFQAIEQGQTMPLVLLTTAQKNALHAEAGLVLFDTTLNKISSYNGSTWESGLTSSSIENHYASLATTISSTSDTAEVSRVSFVVLSAGTYLINAKTLTNGTQATCVMAIKTGSSSYGGATYRSQSLNQYPPSDQEIHGSSIFWLGVLSAYDTVHLGVSIGGLSTNRIIYGDNDYTGATSLSAVRIQ